jgi:hypothetical protein
MCRANGDGCNHGGGSMLAFEETINSSKQDRPRLFVAEADRVPDPSEPLDRDEEQEGTSIGANTGVIMCCPAQRCADPHSAARQPDADRSFDVKAERLVLGSVTCFSALRNVNQLLHPTGTRRAEPANPARTMSANS